MERVISMARTKVNNFNNIAVRLEEAKNAMKETSDKRRLFALLHG
jgi:hypothetical protein